MGKYSDALLSGDPAPPGLPPPISDSAHAAGYGAAGSASYVADPMAQARYFAKRRGIPVERYRVVEDRPAYLADDGQWYFEQPDFNPIRDPGSALTTAAGLPGPMAANIPPLATGIVTAPMALAGPGGLAASMGLTAAAGAAGSAIRDRIGNAITGEDQPGMAGRAIESAAANALGQGVGTGINAFLGRNAAQDLPRMMPAQVSDLQRKSLQEGIPTLPAEQTGLKSLGAMQRMLVNFPASAGPMQEFFDNRARNIDGWVAKNLSNISKVDSGEVAGKNLKDWALTAMEMAKNERAAAASPLYEAAKKSGVQVDPRPVLGFIDRELQSAKGPARAALMKARSYFFKPGSEEVDTSIAGLHSAKLALDDLINGADPGAPVISQGGQKSTVFGTLNRAQEGLVKLMRDASPEYRAGMEKFAEMSKPIDGLSNSLVGVLARTSDANAQKALLNMFNPSTSGPKAALLAKSIFGRLGPEGRDAWQAAKRAFLQDTWAKASKEFATSGQNPASLAGPKFGALLLGDARQREILQTVMDPHEYQSLSNFGDLMKAIGSVKNAGSDTTWNQEMVNRSRDSARPLVMRIIRNLNPAQALRSFDEAVTNWFHGNDLERMAQVYTKPDAMMRLKELKALKPGSQRWVVGVAQLSAELGEGFVDSMFARTTDAVPPQPGQPVPRMAPQTPGQPATRRRSFSDQLLGPQP